MADLPLVMPSKSGSYMVYAGLYNEVGRLSVDAPDNRVLLGSITLLSHHA
jgi:hypothetical protein